MSENFREENRDIEVLDPHTQVTGEEQVNDPREEKGTVDDLLAPTAASPASEDSAPEGGGKDTGVADGPAEAASGAEEHKTPDAESADAETGNGEAEDDQPTAGAENPLETEAEIAADYLEELLDIADLDGDIDTYIEGDRAHVSVVSESTTLVGAHGEVLDALQELARLAVMTETGARSRLMLDVAGFREQRRTELTQLANDAALEAKNSKEPVALSAMNPFERKVVHDAVAAAGLTSASEGQEPKRHVVIIPTT